MTTFYTVFVSVQSIDTSYMNWAVTYDVVSYSSMIRIPSKLEGVEPDLLHVTMEVLVDSNSPALPPMFLPLFSITILLMSQ